MAEETPRHEARQDELSRRDGRYRCVRVEGVSKVCRRCVKGVSKESRETQRGFGFDASGGFVQRGLLVGQAKEEKGKPKYGGQRVSTALVAAPPSYIAQLRWRRSVGSVLYLLSCVLFVMFGLLQEYVVVCVDLSVTVGRKMKKSQ